MQSAALFGATRRRVVLWTISVAGLIMVIFALVAYFMTARVLSGEIDSQLASRASEEQVHLSHDLAPGQFNDHDYNPNTPGVFLLMLSPDGQVLVNSLNVQAQGLPDQAAFQAVLESGQRDVRTVQVSLAGQSVSVRLRSERVVQQDGTLLGVMQLGMSLQPYNHELRDLLLVLGLTGAGGLVLALGGGFFLASRALVPVRAAFHRQRDFVADASHELRTPLMLIRADVDVLGRELRSTRAALLAKTTAEPVAPAHAKGRAVARRDEPETLMQLDDHLELVNDALGEIDRMTRLLSDLLLLARMDAGAAAQTREVVRLDTQLEDLAAQVRRQAEAQGLRVEVSLKPEVNVLGNPDQLRRLWLILLDNATRYNRPNGSITLSCDIEDHRARVSVADTGIGIAPDDLPHIFERFYRVDKARSRAPELSGTSPLSEREGDQGSSGAGLGLALAREILQAHHGQIEVKSTPGQGTVFTIWLPLTPVAAR
jgi:signal transduction histidine kinase